MTRIGVSGSFLFERIDRAGTVLDSFVVPNRVDRQWVQNSLFTEHGIHSSRITSASGTPFGIGLSRSRSLTIFNQPSYTVPASYLTDWRGSKATTYPTSSTYIGVKGRFDSPEGAQQTVTFAFVYESGYGYRPSRFGAVQPAVYAVASTPISGIVRETTGGDDPFANGAFGPNESWLITWRLNVSVSTGAGVSSDENAALLAFLYRCLRTNTYIGDASNMPFAFADFDARVEMGEQPSTFRWSPADQDNEVDLSQTNPLLKATAEGPSPDRTSSRLARTGMLLGSSDGSVVTPNVILDFQPDGTTFDWGDGTEGGLVTTTVTVST